MNSKENIFGERLRIIRSTKNLSQKDFARELGIPQPTLSAYEGGKIKPTIDAVINIAEKCGVSIDWLCGRDNGVQLKSMGDILSCLMELYETNGISLKTTIHNRVDPESADATEDKDRNWIDLKIYYNEIWKNPEATLNSQFCTAIETAYKLTRELRQFERTQESYEREKAFFVENLNDTPLTKVNHSGIPEEEQRRRKLELLKKEWEALGNGK